jgi:hypothetical protein
MRRTMLIVLAGCALVGLSHRTGDVRREEFELLPIRPELTRVLLRSCLPLVVDTYWLRAINTIGTIRTEAEHRNLSQYGQVLTTLDPDFRDAYWLIGLTIPFNRGRENWANGDLAIELLERGVARFPNDVRLRLLLGYSLMSFTDRYVDAARAFQAASRLPKAPSFAALLATRLYLKGDQFDMAVSLAQAMRDAASSDEERGPFEHRVTELMDEKVLRQLDTAAAMFKEKHGRYPAGLEELRGDGITPPDDGRFSRVRFDARGRALLPESMGRVKVFHDSFGGRDDDAPETWR